MKTQLAIRHLLHHRFRTAVATAGVAFSVVLLFMQLGFLGAVSQTATMIYDAMDFDLVLRSPAYLHLSETRTFPRVRLDKAASLPEVVSATPFYIILSEWQSPTSGEWRGILVMGTNPYKSAFLSPKIQEEIHRLTSKQFVLIDEKTLKDFGPQNGKRFGKADIGVKSTLSTAEVQIAGTFELGTGLAANGAVIVNEQGFESVAYGQKINEVNLGLIRLAPGVDVMKAKKALEKAFQSLPDIEVFTREETLAYEHKRWVKDTSLGTIFQLGVVVSLFVGVSIVYQVLSTDISNMMSEYATLKAIGYRDRYLAKIVVQQAALMALLGFLPGLVVSYLLYSVCEKLANIPMTMPLGRIGIVFALTLLICVCSGLFALRKLQQAEPADLF